VLADVLRDAVGGAGSVRLFEGRAPSLQLAALAGVLDALLDFPDGVEVFVELLLVARAVAGSRLPNMLRLMPWRTRILIAADQAAAVASFE
jgi:hypothetical protein